jgi:hypothetical protein
VRAGDFRVTRFLGRIRTRWVGPETWRRADPDGLSFINVNTPEMYEKVKEILSRETTSPSPKQRGKALDAPSLSRGRGRGIGGG